MSADDGGGSRGSDDVDRNMSVDEGGARGGEQDERGGVQGERMEIQKQVARVRQYGEMARGPFVVYVRAAHRHTMDSVKLSSKLFKKYASIEKIDPINRDKIRIEFKDKKDCNALVRDEEFTKNAYVYIPSNMSEIDGKIFLNECEDVSVIANEGFGVIQNSVQEVKVLEAFRLGRKKRVDEKTVSEITPYVRITFEGIILPDYIVINKLRIPVLPYVPRVMRCVLCLRTGHTLKHCTNALRCRRCGSVHKTPEEKEKCVGGAFKCPDCIGIYRDFQHDCPKIKLKRETSVRNVIRRREENRENLIRNAMIDRRDRKLKSRKLRENESLSLRNMEEFPALTTRNKFGVLEVEDLGSEEGEMPEVTDEEGDAMTRKKKKAEKRRISPEQTDGDDSEYFDWTNLAAKETVKKNQVKNPRFSEPFANMTEPAWSGLGAKPKTRREYERPQKSRGHEEDGWKGMIIRFLQKIGLDEYVVNFVKEIILPGLEKAVTALVTKLFGVFDPNKI